LQDYKSVYAAVTICSTLINIQTVTQTEFWSAYINKPCNSLLQMAIHTVLGKF